MLKVGKGRFRISTKSSKTEGGWQKRRRGLQLLKGSMNESGKGTQGSKERKERMKYSIVQVGIPRKEDSNDEIFL